MFFLNKRKKNAQILEESIRASFGHLIYTYKTYCKQADIYASQQKIFKIAQIILSSLTSVGVITLLIQDPFWLKIVTAIIAFLSTCISAYLQNFSLGTMVENCRKAANSLHELREDYILLLTDMHIGAISIEIAHERYKLLREKTKIIYQTAPQTTSRAYEKARKALQKNEESSFRKGEIDQFLPPRLRRDS